MEIYLRGSLVMSGDYTFSAAGRDHAGKRKGQSELFEVLGYQKLLLRRLNRPVELHQIHRRRRPKTQRLQPSATASSIRPRKQITLTRTPSRRPHLRPQSLIPSLLRPPQSILLPSLHLHQSHPNDPPLISLLPSPKKLASPPHLLRQSPKSRGRRNLLFQNHTIYTI